MNETLEGALGFQTSEYHVGNHCSSDLGKFILGDAQRDWTQLINIIRT